MRGAGRPPTPSVVGYKNICYSLKIILDSDDKYSILEGKETTWYQRIRKMCSM